MCSVSDNNDCTCMLYSTVYRQPQSVQDQLCPVCQNDKCCVEISTLCHPPKSSYYSSQKLTSLTSTYSKTRGMLSRMSSNFNTTTYTTLTESPTSTITIIVTQSIIDDASNNIFRANTILVTVVPLSIVIVLIIIFLSLLQQ